MSTAMLNLPLTSALLAALLLGTDGLEVLPLVIVGVAVAYVVSARINPPTPPAPSSPAAAAPAAREAPAPPPGAPPAG